VGFFDPLNLLLGLSLIALLAIYLRARSRPLIEVSSLTLFEEVAAPAARSRMLRLDALFWLEAAALAALTLVGAGLYFRAAQPISQSVRRALVFDLGAAMAAPGSDGTRLAEARREALAIVDAAPAGHQFSVVSYALDAKVDRAYDPRRDHVKEAINRLESEGVATHAVALRAALTTANDAAMVDLFTDHAPSAGMLKAVRRHATVDLHVVGVPADNLAIVSLDPGVPKRSEGRVMVRNFALRPQSCELRIEVANRQGAAESERRGLSEVFHSTLMLEPRASAMVRFGPLTQGGVVHARIITPDGLAADNDRWASAPGFAVARAIVISPDRAARDDLARILLAVNPAYRVTAIDGSADALRQQAGAKFDLAVFHDIAGAQITAPNRLYIFPPAASGSHQLSTFPIIKSVTAAELQSRTGSPPLATPVLLGASRIIAVPDWMDTWARGTVPGDLALFPLAAGGRTPAGWIGMIAFDIRNHALLDPDRQEALLLTIDALRLLAEPSDRKIVATGDLVLVPTFGPTTLIAPDGARSHLTADKAGRVHFRPLQPGRYLLIKDRQIVEVYANYYDEAESDLASVAPSPAPQAAQTVAAAGTSTEVRAVPQTFLLIAIVILALLLESTLLTRRAQPVRPRHV
jgi:hypothetical protein